MEKKVKGSARFDECLECQERQMGCHSHCRAYLETQKAREKIKDAIKKDGQGSYDFAEVRYKHLKSPIRRGER